MTIFDPRKYAYAELHHRGCDVRIERWVSTLSEKRQALTENRAAIPEDIGACQYCEQCKQDLRALLNPGDLLDFFVELNRKNSWYSIAILRVGDSKNFLHELIGAALGTAILDGVGSFDGCCGSILWSALDEDPVNSILGKLTKTLWPHGAVEPLKAWCVSTKTEYGAIRTRRYGKVLSV